MNYRGVTANRQSKYNNSLNDDAIGNIAMQWGQLKVLLPLRGVGEGGSVDACEHMCVNPVFMPSHIKNKSA